MKCPVLPHELDLLGDVPIGSMCELGAKKFGQYKLWFQSQGWRHVSIDLNGLGGALKLDLQQPLDVPALGGPFDVVTNYGTTEHVEEQEPCWCNVNALVKVGGLLVSCTPLDWPRHGRWYPREEWYREFADLNGYEIIDLWYLTDRTQRHTICMRMKKVGDKPYQFPATPIFEMVSEKQKMGAYI